MTLEHKFLFGWLVFVLVGYTSYYAVKLYRRFRYGRYDDDRTGPGF